jgi:hypothetical protein
MGNLVADELLYSDNATIQSLTALATPQTALAANTTRKGGILYNDADQPCDVKLGTGVSATSFSVRLHKKDAEGIGDALNLGSQRVYTGAIEVLWIGTPVGALRVTEVT